MKKIKLANSGFALVDDDTYDLVIGYKWRKDNKGYAVYNIRENGIQKTHLMHREIMKAVKGEEIDHINLNRLDNRLSNLRFCNKSQNQGNTILRKDNTSGFKGVCWHKNTKKWHAQINIYGKRINLGYYSNIEEAVCRYNAVATKHFREFFNNNMCGGIK